MNSKEMFCCPSYNTKFSTEGSEDNQQTEQIIKNNFETLYIEQKQKIIDYKNLNDQLPIQISQLQIRRLNWSDFLGEPDYDEKWSAHIYWSLSYSYDVQFRKGLHKKVNYYISVQTEVHIKDKSWAKKQNNDLLQHEQGHYVIGCLCALEFEKRCKLVKFSDNYRNEIQRIFQKVLNEYSYIERKYDIETNHRLNFENQQKWETYIVNQLLQMRDFFVKNRNYQKNIEIKN